MSYICKECDAEFTLAQPSFTFSTAGGKDACPKCGSVNITDLKEDKKLSQKAERYYLYNRRLSYRNTLRG